MESSFYVIITEQSGCYRCEIVDHVYYRYIRNFVKGDLNRSALNPLRVVYSHKISHFRVAL